MIEPSMTDPDRAVEVHSEQASVFAARYVSEDPYGSYFAYSRKRLDLLLDTYLPPTDDPLKLLDVGCGTGNQLAEWSRIGYQVSGVEPSERMLEYARRNNPRSDIRRASAERLPYPDGEFDRAVSIEVLRYLPDPSECIAEMARVLKPGGVCLATAAPLLSLNGYPLVNRVALALPQRRLTRLRQHFTTSRALRRRFAAAGFQRVEVRGVYLGPWSWVERIAPRALPTVLRAWERVDRALADRALLRDLGNMYLVYAER